MEDRNYYIQQAKEIYQKLLHELLEHENPSPGCYAELFEDAANLYLNLSDDLKSQYLEARQAAVQPPL